MYLTKEIIVNGKVQGVFFRQTAKIMAKEYGVTGTVFNQADGSVHLMASGQEKELERFINWCRNGPARAQVSTITIQDLPYKKFDKFSIL